MDDDQLADRYPAQATGHQTHAVATGEQGTTRDLQVVPPHHRLRLDPHAAGLIAAQRATSTRPFFTYVAFGATHSPHQAPLAFREKYRGRYDEGWDLIRALPPMRRTKDREETHEFLRRLRDVA